MEEILNKLAKAFEEFKVTNNTRLAQLEEKGSSDPLLDEKLNKINGEMSRLETTLKEQSDLQNRIEELEAQVNTPNLGGTESAKNEMESAKVFLATVRRQPLNKVKVSDGDLEQFRGYKNAFLNYLRYGDSISHDQKNALSVGSDPDGGFWVLPDTSGRIVKLIQESSPIRSIANVTSIGTDSLEGFADLDEAASGGWVGEETARPETGTPTLAKWKIDIMEQYANPRATQKMLDDAFNSVEAWLEGKIARKLARTENTAFVSGDGVLKPRGFLTYNHGVVTSANWGSVIEQTPSGAAGAFPAAPGGSNALINMVFGLKADYRGNARFVMARSTVAEVRKLVDGQGNYLWQHDFSQLQGARLLGFPITEAEDMPAIATDSLSIAFGDFREGYQIVDRIGIRVLRDPLTNKPSVMFYTTKRTGGNVLNFEALKIMKFNTTV